MLQCSLQAVGFRFRANLPWRNQCFRMARYPGDYVGIPLSRNHAAGTEIYRLEIVVQVLAQSSCYSRIAPPVQRVEPERRSVEPCIDRVERAGPRDQLNGYRPLDLEARSVSLCRHCPPEAVMVLQQHQTHPGKEFEILADLLRGRCAAQASPPACHHFQKRPACKRLVFDVHFIDEPEHAYSQAPACHYRRDKYLGGQFALLCRHLGHKLPGVERLAVWLIAHPNTASGLNVMLPVGCSSTTYV